MAAVERGPLERLERSLQDGEHEGSLAALGWLAGQGISLADEAVHGPVRRAVLLLAAGGDPHRGLVLESRAVSSLAGELEGVLQEDDLLRELERLRGEAGGLPLVCEALSALISDASLARRALACGLLAEELEAE
jgi:hypothetical protein